ncbi:hypothetical protein P3S68_033199 [Capsicum galapagoense]
MLLIVPVPNLLQFFFDWHDPEFPRQVNVVILGLLKKTNKQQKELKGKIMLKLILYDGERISGIAFCFSLI